MTYATLKNLAQNLHDKDSLRRLFAELNYDFADKPVNKESWSQKQQKIVIEAKIIATKNDYGIHYIQTDSDQVREWKGIASRIIRDNHGYCLVCSHRESGCRWIFSSLAEEFSKSFSETTHAPAYVRPNMGASSAFVRFLDRIRVDTGAAMDTVSRISSAIDSLAVNAYEELVANIFGVMGIPSKHTAHGPEYDNIASFFYEILTKGRKTNTYKFALASFLLSYSKNLDSGYIKYKVNSRMPERIPYRKIAAYFVKYYWHQECKFKIIHNIEPQTLPNAIKIIRMVFGTEYVPGNYYEMDKHKVRDAGIEMMANVFGRGDKSHVVRRFQNIPRSSDKRPLYDYDEEGLLVRPDALRSLHNNYHYLLRITLLEWYKFLEKINTVPQVIPDKEWDDFERDQATTLKGTFEKFTECFYFDVPAPNKNNTDYHIPWQYMLDYKSG